ncbi:ABC transporter ATP-binding protein [Pseudomonas sp. R5(2019)]|uniref:ABC transporter ATP-binding protein n=1 Tax=Pseudomonas sp. R5(2019) TaxID=2697566 RepID=UPI001411F04D|nr:ABC transporter ATP-binding protein [Pseudomonas sp. R5(2019)]NBA94795.1 ATP-binding cassette domain-containing protein [Pseudomonas sp. R5(2019)]
MWRWLIGFIGPHVGALSLVLVLSLAAAAAGLAQPYLTQRLIDDGILKGQLTVVHTVVAVIAVMALLSALLGGITRHVYVSTSAKVLHTVRETLFVHLLTLSPAFFASTRQGDILQRLDGDIAEVQRFVVDAVLSAVNNSVMLIGALLMLASMSHELTLLMLVVLLINGVFLKLIRPALERLNRRARDSGAAIACFFVDILSAPKCVQMFNGQDRERARLEGLHRDLRTQTLHLQLFSYLAGSFPSVMFSLSVAAVFWVGSGRVIHEQTMTLGVLIAFVTYMQKANGPLQSLLGLYVGYQRARVCLGRIQELTRQRPAVSAPTTLESRVVRGHGEVRFDKVSFRYPDNPRCVIDQLSFHIPPASRVAIRGRSGVGKSTLVDLLQRHFDPEAGSIVIDGVDLRLHEMNGLRRSIVVVSQDPQLFSQSLMENIRYGRPHASDEEVLSAASLAGLDEVIRQLPQGAHTSVGQRGAALSGGQRQRVMLARALLMSPSILVLDESTSGVDRQLEAQIHREIDTLFAARTRIYISHRTALDEPFDLVIDLSAPEQERRA